MFIRLSFRSTVDGLTWGWRTEWSDRGDGKWDEGNVPTMDYYCGFVISMAVVDYILLARDVFNI